jgi:hypothetical protein
MLLKEIIMIDRKINSTDGVIFDEFGVEEVIAPRS